MKQLKIIIHPLAIVDILKEFPDIHKKKFLGKKIGTLLGYYKKKKIFCTSSYRIPFQQKTIKNWFIDQVFMEKMAVMHKKINSREKIIGWYALKENLDSSESRVHRIFFGYTHHPVFLHLWVSKEINGFVMDVFLEKQKNREGEKILKTIPVEIGMLESEEVAVHQILSNSKNSPYFYSFDMAKKWKCSVSFLLKYIQKIIRNEKREKFFIDSKLIELKFYEFPKNQEKKNRFKSEKRLLSLYTFSFMRLIESIENFTLSSISIEKPQFK